MKNSASLLSVIFLAAQVAAALGSNTDTPVRSSVIKIVPRPVELTVLKGTFRISPKTVIVWDRSNPSPQLPVQCLAECLESATGYKLRTADAASVGERGIIAFTMAEERDLGAEGYRLEVNRNVIHVRANTAAGFFYGIQTLLQLLPPQAFGTKPARNVQWNIPCVSIRDYPRFLWRGMHLDVSRHFFPAEFIKTYIDMLAMHKMNVFHWHLTDDQGWRMEIRKYPKLTDVAAWRVDREHQDWNYREPQREGERPTYGGFYTQDQIREIVNYAAARNITIVPEIEMPAHTTALLAAYPQFSCTGGPFTVPAGGVWPITDIFCAGNDSTFTFLEDILTEVMEVFPGEFIHIGGDEADKKEWRACPRCQARIKNENLKDEAELQSYFVKRIEKFINSQGRRLIGWDEILEGGLAPNAAVMSWRGPEGGIAAAKQGHDAVMTPGSHTYFNSYQGREELEPPAGGGYIPLRKAYAFEPVPDELTPEEGRHILGAQGCLWAEFVPTAKHAQYMTLPRMAALSEVVWSPRASRDWDDFTRRIEHQMRRYEAAGYAYARSAYQVTISTGVDSIRKRLRVTLATEVSDPSIHYTLDGSNPTAASLKYTKRFNVNRTARIRARAFRGGKPVGSASEQSVFVHKASFRSVQLKYPFEQYTGGGEYGLTDGLRGSLSFADGHWQGFHQYDFEATVDLGKKRPISRISTRFLENTISWIFLPTNVEFAVSDDGATWTPVAAFDEPVPTSHRPPVIKEFSRKLSNMKVRYIRVFARNIGLCPEWHLGRGDKAWVFVDELVAE